MSAEPETGRTVRVWDPLIRIGHWVLVGGFTVAYLTEGDPIGVHSWAGYAIAITVAIRIVWGFVGPKRARFVDFVTGPVRVFGYLRDLVLGRADRHLGHSPAGGAMTVALLFALATTAFSGIGLYAVEDGRGPLAGFVASAPPDVGDGSAIPAGIAEGTVPSDRSPLFLRTDWDGDDDDERNEHAADGTQGREGGHGQVFGLGEETLEEVHEVAANATLALILLHLVGVAVASLAHREILPLSMITGRKRA